MASTTSFPLLRLGRIQLDPRLRALRPGTDASDLVATAAVPVPDSPGEVQYYWEVAWNDAVRQAGQLGATQDTAQALNVGAGDADEHGPGTRVVVAAHGQVLHEQWLGQSIGDTSVLVGPLPHLAAAASAAAARPACVVVVADRDGADVIAHASGSEVAVEHFLVGKREPSQSGHVREEPPAVHHGERNVTGSEPVSGGQANATEVAARIGDAAASVGAHIVLGAGDQHILDAVSAHLSGSLGPIVTIDGRRTRSGRDDHMGRPSAPPSTRSPPPPPARSATRSPPRSGARTRGRCAASRRSPSSWPSSRSRSCCWRPTSPGRRTPATATSSVAPRPSWSRPTR